MGRAVDMTALDHVLLIRIGRSGCTEAAILRDLMPFLAQSLSPAVWRATLTERVAHLILRRQVERTGRTKLLLTRLGLRAAGLKPRDRDSDHWPTVRDTVLMARALGISASTRVVAGLDKVEALRIAVIQHRLGLPVTLTRVDLLRRRLIQTIVEPERIAALPRLWQDERVTRLIASPAKDADWLARLAGELLGLGKADAVNLRTQIVRNYLAPQSATVSATVLITGRDDGTAGVDFAPTIEPPPRAIAVVPAAVNTDLPRFAATVRELAAINATGWSGNRRAYISHVWRAVCATQPHWELNENRFKSLLMDAHRGGHLELVNADLKDRTALRDIEASATAYNNTVWHLIRVGEQ